MTMRYIIVIALNNLMIAAAIISPTFLIVSGRLNHQRKLISPLTSQFVEKNFLSSKNFQLGDLSGRLKVALIRLELKMMKCDTSL